MDGSKLAVLVVVLLLIAGLAYGLAHDFGSRVRGTVRATIIEARPAHTPHKAPAPTPAKLTARLADERVVDVRTSQTRLPAPNSEVDLLEMVSPWGISGTNSNHRSRSLCAKTLAKNSIKCFGLNARKRPASASLS